MRFGNGSRQELVIERRIEPFFDEAPKVAGANGLETRPEIANVAREAEGAAKGQVFFIVQHNGNGTAKIQGCENAQEAKMLLEELLMHGVSPENLEVFQAARATFNVRYRPLVNLSTL